MQFVFIETYINAHAQLSHPKNQYLISVVYQPTVFND